MSVNLCTIPGAATDLMVEPPSVASAVLYIDELAVWKESMVIMDCELGCSPVES